VRIFKTPAVLLSASFANVCLSFFLASVVFSYVVDGYQVVLRKAQHLREHSLNVGKSSIGQDHSYVRSDHAAQTSSTDFDGLEALIKAISYRESEGDVSDGKRLLFLYLVCYLKKLLYLRVDYQFWKCCHVHVTCTEHVK